VAGEITPQPLLGFAGFSFIAIACLFWRKLPAQFETIIVITLLSKKEKAQAEHANRKLI